MLTCGAIRRSRDKKPDDNRMDWVPASLPIITEPVSLSSTVTENLNALSEFYTKSMKETNDLMKLSGLSIGDDFAKIFEGAELAANLYGEP